MTLPEPYYHDERAGITVYCGDCRDILPDLEPPAILTDPPYGIGYEVHQTRRTARSTVRSSGGVYGRDWGKIAGDSERFDPSHLLALSCPMILWGANNYNQSIPESGRWLVWDKKRGGTAGRGFHASDAELAWCSVGKRVALFSYFWDGFRRQGEIHEHYHPTQKPQALMRWCVELLGADGVTDPYMGSGTTLVAARDMGIPAIGIELSEDHCRTAVDRLRQEVFTWEP